MGVIGGENRSFIGLIEDVHNEGPEAEFHPPINEDEIENNLINNVINVAAAAEAEEELARRAQRKIKNRNPVKPTSFTLRTKHIGAKKHRRYENALQMLDSVNSDELEFDEVTIGDFMSKRISAFSKLLEERENLKLWNDFINCSEEKQVEMLTPSNCSYCESVETEDATSVDSAKRNIKKKTGQKNDNPKVCFHRIGNGFRAMLKKNQVPMGVLSHLENELVEFFTNWPRSTYVSQLPNGFERLILHALCQYLNLIAKSFGGNDDRRTQVENPCEVFKMPPILLTQFIEKNCQKL